MKILSIMVNDNYVKSIFICKFTSLDQLFDIRV